MDLEVLENEILSEIYSYCENCKNRLSCVENECILFRIENLIINKK